MAESRRRSTLRTFDARDAARYGLVGAVLLADVRFWIDVNRKNEAQSPAALRRHYRDGTWWTYATDRELSERHPYLSPDQVRRARAALVADGALRVARFDGFDRRTWYSIDASEVGDDATADAMPSHSADSPDAAPCVDGHARGIETRTAPQSAEPPDAASAIRQDRRIDSAIPPLPFGDSAASSFSPDRSTDDPQMVQARAFAPPTATALDHDAAKENKPTPRKRSSPAPATWDDLLAMPFDGTASPVAGALPALEFFRRRFHAYDGQPGRPALEVKLASIREYWEGCSGRRKWKTPLRVYEQLENGYRGALASFEAEQRRRGNNVGVVVSRTASETELLKMREMWRAEKDRAESAEGFVEGTFPDFETWRAEKRRKREERTKGLVPAQTPAASHTPSSGPHSTQHEDPDGKAGLDLLFDAIGRKRRAAETDEAAA